MFEKIMVPLDGSELSERALPSAISLARPAGSDLLLVRSMVDVYRSAAVMTHEYGWVWQDDVRDETRRDATAYLETIGGRIDCPECHLDLHVEEGEAAAVIIDTAAAEDVDLIVMSTHNRSGLGGLFFGSVTERVLGEVRIPVLVTRSTGPFNCVLVTLDGSMLAERAIPPAQEAADRWGARMILLRVNEPVGTPAPDMTTWESEERAAEIAASSRLREASETYLASVMERYELAPDTVQTLVVEGPPEKEILEVAALYGADVIAMATHGRTGLRRWLYGSVTTRVMRSIDCCSMLIVRPPDKAFNE